MLMIYMRNIKNGNAFCCKKMTACLMLTVVLIIIKKGRKMMCSVV